MLLSAGELVDFSVGEFVELDGGECFVDSFFHFGLGDFADLEAEADVLPDGHVWPERVALEDHAGVAFVGGRVCDVFFTEVDGAVGGLGESGDHAEECCFAAARWAEQEEEVACGDVEVDVIDGDGGAEVLGELADGDRGHGMDRVTRRGGWVENACLGAVRVGPELQVGWVGTGIRWSEVLRFARTKCAPHPLSAKRFHLPARCNSATFIHLRPSINQPARNSD